MFSAFPVLPRAPPYILYLKSIVFLKKLCYSLFSRVVLRSRGQLWIITLLQSGIRSNAGAAPATVIVRAERYLRSADHAAQSHCRKTGRRSRKRTRAGRRGAGGKLAFSVQRAHDGGFLCECCAKDVVVVFRAYFFSQEAEQMEMNCAMSCNLTVHTLCKVPPPQKCKPDVIFDRFAGVAISVAGFRPLAEYRPPRGPAPRNGGKTSVHPHDPTIKQIFYISGSARSAREREGKPPPPPPRARVKLPDGPPPGSRRMSRRIPGAPDLRARTGTSARP